MRRVVAPEMRLSGHLSARGPVAREVVVGAIALVLLMVVPTGAVGSGSQIAIWTRSAPTIPNGGGTNWLTAMSTYGNVLYAGTASGHLLRYSGSGARLWTRALGAEANSIASDASGNLVAVAAGAEFRVFSGTGVQLWKYTIGGVVSGGVAARVAFSRDGGTLIGAATGPTGDPTGMLYSFVPATGQLRWTYSWGTTFAVVHAIAVSWNGTRIGLALGNGFADGGSAAMFDGAGHLLWSHDLPGIVTSVSMAKDGAISAFGSYGVWYAAQGSLVAVYGRGGAPIASFNEGGRVWCLGLRPGGNEIAVTEGPYLYLVVIGSGTVLWRHWLGTVTLVNSPYQNSVVVGDGGDEIVTGSPAGVVHLFSPTGGYLLKISLSSDHAITSLSLSPRVPVVWIGTNSSVMRVDGL